MHRIELNTDKQPIFGLPNRFHLTWENPGPIEVDITDYTEQEKNWLRNAKMKDVLKIENMNPEAKKEVTPAASRHVSQAEALHAMQGKVFGPASIPPKSREQLSNEIKEKAETMRLQRVVEVKKTLTAPMAALTRFIEKCGDLLQLRVMRDEESTGKSRPKVLGLLDVRIKTLADTIGSIVGPALDGGAIAKEANLPDIEEEVLETVAVRLGAED